MFLVLRKAGTISKHQVVVGLKQLSSSDVAAKRSEIEKLRALVVRTGKPIRVQYGEVTPTSSRYPLDAKLVHAFESTLQVLERPHSYVGSVRTFEAVLEATPRSWARALE